MTSSLRRTSSAVPSGFFSPWSKAATLSVMLLMTQAVGGMIDARQEPVAEDAQDLERPFARLFFMRQHCWCSQDRIDRARIDAGMHADEDIVHDR